MIFVETRLQGALVVEPERREDERGFFARTFCQREFADLKLETRLVQCNLSYNKRLGTLRGMHFQIAPHAETKLVRCTMGAIFDVIVDLRPDSPTFKQWVGVKLTAENRLMLYIPVGLAHGFITLMDDTEVFYQMSEFYNPESSRGVRWDDPAFGIELPLLPRVISDKDQRYPDFTA
jgi:dTDP-4-dehydrorhamnose 3,5-epimerase